MFQGLLKQLEVCQRRFPIKTLSVVVGYEVFNRRLPVYLRMIFRQQFLDGAVQLRRRVEMQSEKACNRYSRSYVLRYHPVLHALKSVIRYKLQKIHHSSHNENELSVHNFHQANTEVTTH